MYGRDVVASSSKDGQRLFLFKGLFELLEEGILAHAIDNTAADDTACNFIIEMIDAKGHIL